MPRNNKPFSEAAIVWMAMTIERYDTKTNGFGGIV